jgi:fibronectin-binding autotransporter adhesin
MAGYTRQSVASIINGANITAPPLNAEFNQLLAAFSGSTGHTHTGGTGDAPPIPLATSVSGYLLPANGGVGGKNSNAQSTNPVVGDDNADGYAPGSIWLNGTNNRLFVNLNNSTGAAVWGEYLLNNASNQVLPHTDDTVDLGSSTKQFKDLYIDGTAYVDTLNADAATIGGTLGVTGAITFSSTAAITGNTTVGGTLGVTGATTLSDNLSVSGNTTVSGNTSLNGNTTVGNAASDTVTFTSQVASDFIPSTDGTHDLGSSTKEWQDLYIDGTANIDSLVADTADIDGGSIDGTVIGGSVQSSGQFSSVTSTNLTASGAISFAAATISNLGTVTTANIDGGTIDGVTLGVNSPITNAQVDNININGSAITSTNTNGNIAITPNGSGEVDISKVDIDSGTIDNTAIGSSTASSGAFTTVTTSGQATLASADINGGTVDGAVIGGSSPQAITGTTITANTGFVGGVTGNVTGNLTGNVTGNVTGDLTGDVTGNITASSGTSTVQNLVVNGTANFTNTPLTNISDPSSAQDAATKNYVDTQVAGLVDSAPGTLDTLNELAAALGDDPDFATTITNSIATKLPLAGGTMSGAIAMGTSKITGVGDPTANQDAATKNYTDTQDALKLNLSGGTMSGAIAMGTNKITGAGDPTNAQDVATKNYIDTLFGSTTSAASSASAAATSATNAATSATNAASSATAAATSATNAANSYDDFDDRYLGAKSSAPTTDNDGDALVIGALYFDTTGNSMKVYSSGGWVAAGSSVNGTSQRYDYVVGTNSGSYTDGSTTTFPATYDAGFVDVYLNGVKLVVGTDVTASSGTSVVLASPAATGDNICIVGFGTFQLANFSVGEANDVDLTGNANNAILAYDSTDSRFEPTLTPTLTSLTTTGSITTAGLTTSADINFGDDDKAVFGADSDLQIYHVANSSNYIEASTGNIFIRNSSVDNDIILQADDGSGGLTNYIQADGSNGEVRLYHYGSEKLNTTSTGVDVTGTAVTDGLTSSGDVLVGTTSGTSIKLNVDSSKANGLAAQFSNSDSSTGSGIVVKGGNNGSTYSADFRDYDNNSLMRIRGDGSVGIGTTSIDSSDGRLKLSAPSGHSNVAGVALYGNNGSAYGGSNVARSKIESKHDGTAYHFYRGSRNFSRRSYSTATHWFS